MSGCREVEVGANRVRYRENPGFREGNGFRFSLEYKVGGEWKPCRNWSSRDWFAFGYAAGQETPVQEEFGL